MINWQQLANIGESIINEVAPIPSQLSPRNQELKVSGQDDMEKKQEQRQVDVVMAVPEESEEPKEIPSAKSEILEKTSPIMNEIAFDTTIMSDRSDTTRVNVLLHSILECIDSSSEMSTLLESLEYDETKILANTIVQTVLNRQLKLTQELDITRKEVDRLRVHLVEVEDMHTRDLVEMQTSLETMEEQYISAKSKLETYQSMYSNRENDVERENLELNEENSRLKGELETKTAEINALKEQNKNFEGIISGYEVAKLAEMDIVTSHLRKQAEILRQEAETANKRAEKAQEIWNGLGISEEEARNLAEKTREQQRIIERLQKQVSHLSTALAASSFYTNPDEPVIKALSESSGKTSSWLDVSGSDTISIGIVSNLLMQYFNAQDQQKLEILVLITKILKMTDKERNKIGLVCNEHGNWIRGRKRSWKDDLKVEVQEASLTDMWISFLLNEAKTPQENDNFY